MRRMLSLLTLLCLMTGQVPAACDPAHEAEHGGEVAHAHHDGGTEAQHRLSQNGSAPIQTPGAPCAALVRCHWTAIPGPGASVITAGDATRRVDLLTPLAALSGHIPALPVPPPKAFA